MTDASDEPVSDDETDVDDDNQVVADDEFFKFMLITGLGRLYDVLLMLLTAQTGDDKAASMLRRLHSEGKLFFPPPAAERTDDV